MSQTNSYSSFSSGQVPVYQTCPLIIPSENNIRIHSSGLPEEGPYQTYTHPHSTLYPPTEAFSPGSNNHSEVLSDQIQIPSSTSNCLSKNNTSWINWDYFRKKIPSYILWIYIICGTIGFMTGTSGAISDSIFYYKDYR